MPPRQNAKISKSIDSNENTLNGLVAYNKYGGYLTPLSSQHRPAVQKILNGQVYEPDTIQFMVNNCGKGDIIHAGTFFGDFLPALSSAISSNSYVWAFEPSKENYRCAKITTMINELDNVKLFNSGLGETSKTSKMVIKTNNGVNLGGASRILDENENIGTMIDVDVVKIDDMVGERDISIIQLDVEGYEQQALAGAIETIKRCKPLLILEDNKNIIKSQWFKDNIISLNYHIVKKLHENTLLKCRDI